MVSTYTDFLVNICPILAALFLLGFVGGPAELFAIIGFIFAFVTFNPNILPDRLEMSRRRFHRRGFA